ncbi:MAG: hypothetical protein IJJ11_03155 [Methanosphaera sp.]|nr:hypothetical protein [Methanosphaera sp.]
MYANLNINFSLGNYPEEMIDVLLELYNKIKDKFKFINKNMEVLSIDDSLDSVDLIMDSLNKLADMLEVNPLFEKEYFLALSIINDIEFIILDHKDLLKDNLVFIGNIVINFCNLICDKQDLLLSKKIINYEEEYQDYLVYYNNQKEYYFSKLPDVDEDFDEVIDEVTNIMW